MATQSASLTRPVDPAKALLRSRVSEYVSASQDPSGVIISAEQAAGVWREMKGVSGFYSLGSLVPEAQQAYEQGAQGLIQRYPTDPRLGDMVEEWRNHCFATFPAQPFQVNVLTPEDARAVKGTFDRVKAQDPDGVYSYHPNVQPNGSATVEIGTTLAHQSEFYAALAGARRSFVEGEQRAVLNAGQALAQMGQQLVARNQALTAKEQQIAQQAAAREREVAEREQAVEQGKEYLKVFRVTSPTLVYYKEFPAYVQDTLAQEALAKGHTTDGKADVVAYLMTPEGRLKVSDVKNAMDKFREITPHREMIGAFEARNDRKPWYQTLVSDPTKAVQDLSEMIQIRGIMDAEQGLSDLEKRVLDLRLGLTQGGTVYEKPLAQVAENLVQVRGQRGHSKGLWSVWGWNREALDFALDDANNLLTAEERIYAEAALRRPVWGGYGWRDNFDGQVPVSVANSVRDGYRIAKGAVKQKDTRLEPSVTLAGNNYENRWLGRIGVETEAEMPAAPRARPPTAPAQPNAVVRFGRWASGKMKGRGKKIVGATATALGAVYGAVSYVPQVHGAANEFLQNYSLQLVEDPTVKAVGTAGLVATGLVVYNWERISNFVRGSGQQPQAAPAVPSAASQTPEPPAQTAPPQGPPAGPPQQEPPPVGQPQAQDGAQGPPAGAQAPADAATPQGPPAGAPAQGQTQGTQ